MKFSSIKETSLYVKNLDRTEDFYAGKLKLEIISQKENRHIFFKAGSSVLLCFLANATLSDENLHMEPRELYILLLGFLKKTTARL
jgi:catechol 2,3-dioxygenase-like lactoylglutathione lyase family enzyme